MRIEVDACTRLDPKFSDPRFARPSALLRQKNVIFDSYRENVREKGGERGEAGWLYERTTAKLLENDKIQNEGQSSLRFGTFDLLNLLSTQEAVHRVLRANMEGETGKPSQAYEVRVDKN